jgi:ElaB/YqjD/DUF883 family membrane-anchored ribosome-binding protein
VTTPPPINEPTLGEVLRRIDGLTQQVRELVAELKEDRVAAERTYMRQDVFASERKTLESNLSDVRTDITAVAKSTEARFERLEERQRADATSRRQQWTAIGTCAVMALLAIVALVVQR